MTSRQRWAFALLDQGLWDQHQIHQWLKNQVLFTVHITREKCIVCVLFCTFNVKENVWGEKYSTLFLKLENKTSYINFASENIFILGIRSCSYDICPWAKNERGQWGQKAKLKKQNLLFPTALTRISSPDIVGKILLLITRKTACNNG